MIVKDPEAFEWRKAHLQEVRKQVERFLERVYRKSSSSRSADSKLCAISVFCGWQRKLPIEILDEVKGGKVSPYRLLDDFVTYLVRMKNAPHTTKNYLSSVKRWMKYEGVELSSDKLRDMVDLPRQYSITRDRIPTGQELRDMVLVSKARGKALLSVLASSGMRVGEMLALRVRDIEFGAVPTRIHLGAETTKERQERWCFVSDEATAFLRGYLGDRVDEPDCFVFLGRHQGVGDSGATFETSRAGSPTTVENRPITYWDADVLFSTALKNAGHVEKDDHNRDRIHIHSLRKFFFTRMLAVLGREITEALMGHKEYLDAAYRRYTLEELGKHYLEGMDAVTVMANRSVSRDEVEKRVELENYKFYISNSELGESVEKTLALAVREKGRKLSLEEECGLFKAEYETLKEQERALLEEGTKRVMEGAKPEQRRVSEESLDDLLNNGWVAIMTLPSGKVIVQRA